MCDCISFLRHRGLQEVGIFRIPGNADTVSDLKRLYNKTFDSKKAKESSETSILNEYQPHSPGISDVASLLKAFFKDLAEPLVPAESLRELLYACKHVPSEDDMVYEMSKTIKAIPSPNRECFSFLISYLREVCVFKKYHNMGPDNLATCFVLSVFAHGNSSSQLANVGSGAIVVRNLINLPVTLYMPQLKVVQNNTKYRVTTWDEDLNVAQFYAEGSLTKKSSKTSMKKRNNKDKKRKKNAKSIEYHDNGTRILQEPVNLADVIDDRPETMEDDFRINKYANDKNMEMPPPPVFEEGI